VGWLRLVLNWPDYDVFGKELGANITTKNNDVRVSLRSNDVSDIVCYAFGGHCH